MWFLTVGMHEGGFVRLVRAADDLAAQGKQEIVAQIADTPYRPRHLRWFRYASDERMVRIASAADVVIAHCGAGSVLLALRLRKPLVVVPRLRRFGEHHDDHQLQLARYLGKQGSAVVVEDEKELEAAVESAKPPPPVDSAEHRKKLIAYIESILSEAARL